MISFIDNATEILKFVIVYEMGLQLEHRKEKKYYCMAVAYYVIASAIMEFLPDTVNSFGIYTLFVVIETMILYNEPFISKLLISLWAMGAIGSVDGIIYIVLKMLLSQQGNFNERLVRAVATFITIIFLLLLFQRYRGKKQYALKNVKKKYLVCIFVIGIVNEVAIGVLLKFIDLLENEPKMKENLVLISVFFIVGLFFQVAFILQLATTNQVLKEKEELIRKSLKMQEENYRYLEKKEQETKKFRHDIRKHLYVIEALGKRGEYEEQQGYLKAILGKVTTPKDYINVNNGIVNAILNKYVEICNNEEILFQVKGKMPQICYVDSYDLCTIFANLLENAVEAVRSVEDKKIALTIRYDESMIFIQEENSYSGTINIHKGSIITTKKEQEFHGYGIRNMRESIENYGGCMNYYTTNELFQIKIILYNIKKGKTE